MTSSQRGRSYRFLWERKFRYAATRDKKLKHLGYIAWELAGCANTDGTSIRPGHDALAKALNLSESAVTKQIRKLIQLGWLRRDSAARSPGRGGGHGKAAVYSLVIPNGSDSTGTTDSTVNDSDSKGTTESELKGRTETGNGRTFGANGSDSKGTTHQSGHQEKKSTNHRNHLGAEPSPPVPRDDDTANRDTSEQAPDVPGEVFFSFTDENHAADFPCEEPGCTTGHRFPDFRTGAEVDFVCPQCQARNAGHIF